MTIEEKIANLLEITNFKGVTSRVFTQIFDLMVKPFAKEGFGKDLNLSLTEEDLQNILTTVIPAYKEVFTEKEIDDVMAFYSTESGKSFLEKTPELNLKVQAAIEASCSGIMQRLLSEVDQQIGNEIAH